MVKGVIGGVGDFAVGAVTTPIYAVTHLSDAAAGLQCLVLDGCLQGAAHDLGWDKPVENLGKGWDTFVHMSDEEKASFATTVTLTGLTLRGGFRGIRGMRAEAPDPSTGLSFSDPKLASQMAQHGEDFGFGNESGTPDARLSYLSALVDHIDSPGTTTKSAAHIEAIRRSIS